MEWYMAIVYSIISVCCCCYLREVDSWKEVIFKIAAIVTLPTILVVAFVKFILATNKSIMFLVIFEIGLCISIVILLLMFEWNVVDLSTFWGIAFVVIIGMAMFWTGCDSRVKTTSEKQIAWDYDNPDITVTKYEIIGIRENSIIISVALEEEIVLRNIPIEEIKINYQDNVLIPYVYRENYKYTEYDYSKNPPQELRYDTSTWTEYVLCGTKQQIQTLFGYQENFVFEQ